MRNGLHESQCMFATSTLFTIYKRKNAPRNSDLCRQKIFHIRPRSLCFHFDRKQLHDFCISAYMFWPASEATIVLSSVSSFFKNCVCSALTSTTVCCPHGKRVRFQYMAPGIEIQIKPLYHIIGAFRRHEHDTK